MLTSLSNLLVVEGAEDEGGGLRAFEPGGCRFTVWPNDESKRASETIFNCSAETLLLLRSDMNLTPDAATSPVCSFTFRSSASTPASVAPKLAHSSS
eukprot:1583148-Prymnesium_polylepis.1